jgi:hypothetical protein
MDISQRGRLSGPLNEYPIFAVRYSNGGQQVSAIRRCKTLDFCTIIASLVG